MVLQGYLCNNYSNTKLLTKSNWHGIRWNAWDGFADGMEQAAVIWNEKRGTGQDGSGWDGLGEDDVVWHDMIHVCVVDGSRGRWDDGILWV